MRSRFQLLSLAIVLAELLGGCGAKEPIGQGEPQAAREEQLLRVYNRSGYIAEQTVAGFRETSGIQVEYGTFDSATVLEIKLLVGRSGYDLVVPSASFVGRHVTAGMFLELDRNRLPNFANLDAGIMERLASHDPGNRHAVPYLWGTTGIGYNPELVRQALGKDQIDSWSAIFEPDNAARLAGCGIAILDSPGEALGSTLIYLGRDPNSESQEDLAAAEALLLGIRPYVRYLDSAQYIDDLANGRLCIALGRNGAVLQARARGAAADPAVHVAYVVPAEGAVMWVDVLAIPADAQHPSNAHALINHLLDPQVIAGISNRLWYANGNAASVSRLDAALRDDPAVFPPPETSARLQLQRAQSPEFVRLTEKSWVRIRAVSE